MVVNRATHHIFIMFDDILEYLSERLKFVPNFVWRHEFWKQIAYLTADLGKYTRDLPLEKSTPALQKNIKRLTFLGFF